MLKCLRVQGIFSIYFTGVEKLTKLVKRFASVADTYEKANIAVKSHTGVWPDIQAFKSHCPFLTSQFYNF